MTTLQNKNLHYRISDWSQVTECLSNNSNSLYLSYIKLKDINRLEGHVIQVNHTTLGTLFAAMIDGNGMLIDNQTESGYHLPFMSTKDILTQVARFGFYIEYCEKKHLPDKTLVFLFNLMKLNYDRITKVLLQTTNRYEEIIWSPTILVFKSCSDNTDLITYGSKLSRAKYIEKVNKNTVLNVTAEDIRWDWVDSMYNLSDIVNDNVDCDCCCDNVHDYEDNPNPEQDFTIYSEDGVNLDDTNES